MLAQTDLSLAGIAYAVGFSNQGIEPVISVGCSGLRPESFGGPNVRKNKDITPHGAAPRGRGLGDKTNRDCILLSPCPDLLTGPIGASTEIEPPKCSSGDKPRS